MTNQARILASKKPTVLHKYMERVADVVIPEGMVIPSDPREALLLGLKLARQQGYEDGLVDGVKLGASLVFEATTH